jgi:hypothetical protein
MKRKKDKSETEFEQKSVLNQIFDINFIVYINRDQELIRRLKTTMVSFHDSQVDLSEKKSCLQEQRGTLKQNQKVIMQ